MSTHRTLALLVAPVVAVALFTGCAAGGASQSPAASAPASASADAVNSADKNSADKMFAAMMIPHHRQAIEMSDTLLAKSGVAPDVAALARRVKSAQGPEIERMSGWLTAWGVDATADSGMAGMDHGSMDGMMSDADMTALAKADGAAASRLYLTQMIAHHEGALTMAQAEQKNGKNPAAVALAAQIITAQQAEIAEMRRMLAG
jgi:uncharacterized protein (DUF305 family)